MSLKKGVREAPDTRFRKSFKIISWRNAEDET